MLSQKLMAAFSSEEYLNLSSKMSQLLAKYLDQCKIDQEPTITITNPESEYLYWKRFESKDPETLFEALIERSIKLHNPKYIGHQVAVPLPVTAVISELAALLNNGMAVYEMGAAATAIEKLCFDMVRTYFGYDDHGSGFFTSGGSLANLTALLCARSNKVELSWSSGSKYNQYAFMVSEEAHYCIDRAVKIMGWGDEGCIKIPVDEKYSMRVDLLEQYYEEATNRGVKVIGIVGSAPTTSTGIHDNLKQIGAFADKYQLWFHVDAAHGGPAAFTTKYKYLVDGIEMADSITMDCHKMMMTPALTTMLMFKKSHTSYETFAQKAQYLWIDNADEWYTLGKRTIECTKVMMACRTYAVLQLYGIELISEYVAHCYDLARWFAVQIDRSDVLDMATWPQSNIVCFRYINGHESDLNKINAGIRQALLDEGQYYIVQTNLQGKLFLRVTIINPMTSRNDLQMLIDKITTLGEAVNI